MKRTLLIIFVAILIVITTVMVALAASAPTADAYVRSTNPTTSYNDGYLSLYTNGSGCTTQDYAFIKFDLSSVSQEIGRATLTLTTAAAPSSVVAGSTKVSLYQVTDDTWSEGTGGVTWNTAPVLGPELLPAIDAPTANGQVIVFGSGLASSALSNYLQAEAIGDNVASFAIKLTGTCNSVTTGVRFASKENSTAANRPSLELFSPNAVTLSDSTAERVTWPLYAGLGAVALILVAGLAISRRRTA